MTENTILEESPEWDYSCASNLYPLLKLISLLILSSYSMADSVDKTICLHQTLHQLVVSSVLSKRPSSTNIF